MRARYQSDRNEYAEIQISFKESEFSKVERLVENLRGLGYDGLELDMDCGVWTICAPTGYGIDEMKFDYKKAKAA